MVDKNISNDSLNISSLQLVVFLKCCGSELNNLPPCTWRVASLKDLTLFVDFLLMAGSFTCRPFVSERDTSTPGFGTFFNDWSNSSKSFGEFLGIGIKSSRIFLYV